MRRFGNPLVGLSKSDRIEVIEIFTSRMLDSLPQLQAQWCTAADGLQATVRELDSDAAIRHIRTHRVRMSLRLNMRYMEREANAGPLWQEAVNSVITAVITSEARQSPAGSVAAIKAIPDLERKTLKALMCAPPPAPR